MSYPIEIKEKAIKLRKQGFSLTEIVSRLHIAKSTASEWLSIITLDNKAQLRLKRKMLLGQYKSMQIARKKRLKQRKLMDIVTKATVSKIPASKDFFKLIASVLFWTEGGKNTDKYVYFTNSDPKMVSLFIYLLRNSFILDESKFRAMLHLHEYHDEREQLSYWSKIIKLPISQFSKSYQKPHTGKRIRTNYQGCIRIRYYDAKIALELRSLYNTYVDNLKIS